MGLSPPHGPRVGSNCRRCDWNCFCHVPLGWSQNQQAQPHLCPLLGERSWLDRYAGKRWRPAISRLRDVTEPSQDDLRWHNGDVLSCLECDEDGSIFRARPTVKPKSRRLQSHCFHWQSWPTFSLYGSSGKIPSSTFYRMSYGIRVCSFDGVDMAGPNLTWRQTVNFHQPQCCVPSPDDLVVRAEGLIPFLRERASEADRSTPVCHLKPYIGCGRPASFEFCSQSNLAGTVCIHRRFGVRLASWVEDAAPRLFSFHC